MGITAKVCANPGADRVHPDVPGNGIRRFVRAENVIEEESLPNRRMRLPLDMKPAGLLHGFHELRKVAQRIEALHQKMDVVRHEAVRMDGKRLLSRLCGESREKVGAQIRIKKELFPLETAEGNKVASRT